MFTLNNRFFRHQACYSLLPAKPGGQADRVISLCKYKVVGGDIRRQRENTDEDDNMGNIERKKEYKKAEKNGIKEKGPT